MPDLKPPRVVGDERATILALLDYQRRSVVRKVAGVSDEDARTSPLPTGTSLLWLVRHLAHAEHLWVVDRFAGLADPPPPHPDPRLDHLADAVRDYEAGWARLATVVAGHDLDDRCSNNPGDEPVDLRWVLLHLLEETARHAGHADVLRELLDGETGR